MDRFVRHPAAIARLTPEQHRVTQQSGTEMPGTGAYLHNKEPGIYVDIVSGESLGRARTEVRSAHGDMEKEGYGAYLNQVGDKS